ncbi:MAG: hypothetical protein HN736_12275 [Anaerolineae bacterium]|jgi:hypothetical protein|nr:hypothetical protein [Anaerolineae bacterium]MBT4309647.1 hypothetical protein [Anaerolineae bacterium]MBT4458308.1 hypothetical protein [Anaerolineae bacterium]MBT4841685.1 hypothetical protein [Anaerolineae bacterium]MBT6061835.1 hypothetical protein [Anaerolineae bacterium]
MKKIPAPWHLIIGLILGLGLGLVISWGIAPVETTDAPPSLLRSDFKDKYRALIAYAYASTDDFDRAKDRLASLNDSNSIEALQSQAQRALADDASPESVDALAALAADLEYETIATQITATSTRFFTQTPRASTQTGTPSTPSPTEAATLTLTPIPINTRTPPATTEASLTPGAPYILQTQDEICSTNISEGLMMVYVSDASQKAVSGVEIIIEWDGNEEHFFTGLKPELGNGYADFTMDTNRSYSLRLAAGSTATTELSAPPCQDDDGNHYWGSLRLRFQQP